MALVPFTLAQALQAIGVAEVYLGNPMVADGMVSIGATEGPITFAAPQEPNQLAAPELTGAVPHQSTVTLGDVTLRFSVIMGDPDLYPKISPTGAASGGSSIPTKVTETSALLIPRAEVGGGLAYPAAGPWARTAGFGVGAATGAGAAPVNAIWLWRCYPTFGDLPFAYPNGGKVLVEVTLHGMFDVSKPEGHKVYSVGDPQAITPTPIDVEI